MDVTLNTSEWQILKELRQVFLGEASDRQKDYWSSRPVLDLYDRTFARRIGWKWDAVLEELKAKHVELTHTWAKLPVVDVGCGTGVAVERWISQFGETPPTEIHLLDRSKMAMALAKEKVLRLVPTANVVEHTTEYALPPDALVLVSHVANELGSKDLLFLEETFRRSAAFVWVEPGTKAGSQNVISVREKLRGSHHWLAPCPHQGPCGLATGDRADWCHHFAPSPTEVFQSAFWSRFNAEMKIDLRSLPTTYLVGVRGQPSAAELSPRVLGRARVYKGYAKALVCEANGVSERRVMARHSRETVKRLEEGNFSESIAPEFFS